MSIPDGEPDWRQYEIAVSQFIEALSGIHGPAALQQAKDLGFECCELYEGEAPKIPESLIVEVFHFSPQFRVALFNIDSRLKTWSDVLRLPDGPDGTLLDSIAQQYSQQQDSAKQAWADHGELPPKWSLNTSLKHTEEGCPELVIKIEGGWKVYRGSLNAYRLDGSLNVTSGEFKGGQFGPMIDTWSEHPGPGWKEVEAPIEKIPSNRLELFKILDVRERLEHLCDSPLSDPDPSPDSENRPRDSGSSSKDWVIIGERE